MDTSFAIGGPTRRLVFIQRLKRILSSRDFPHSYRQTLVLSSSTKVREKEAKITPPGWLVEATFHQRKPPIAELDF